MRGPKFIPEVARTGSILTSINFNFYGAEDKMNAGSNGIHNLLCFYLLFSFTLLI